MHTKKLKGLFALAGIAFASVLMSCGSNPDTAPVVVSSIVITAPDGAVPVTGTMQFVATVTDASGNTITQTPTWTLVNGGGAITTDGFFTAGDSVGTFTNTIVATIGSVSTTITVSVSAGGFANITIVPALDTLSVDAAKQFAAVGHDAFRHVVDIPAGLVWSVSSPTAGTIDTTGHFSAGSVPGAYTISATSGTIVGHASIVVIPGPLASITVSPPSTTLDMAGTQQYTATGHDVHGNVVAIEPTWSVLPDQGDITVNGLYTANTSPGTHENAVSATSGVISGQATVIVNPGPLFAIMISPANPTVLVGTPQQFTATGRDAGGYPVPITPVFSVAASGASAGSISPDGAFIAYFNQGYYQNAIVATVGSIVGTTGVQVFNPFILPCISTCGGIP